MSRKRQICCVGRRFVVKFCESVVKSEHFLVVVYIQLPFALESHNHLDGSPDAALASILRTDIISNLLHLVHSVCRADSAAAGHHHRDVRNIISEVHHLLSLETVSGAEVVEVLDLRP